MKQKLGSPLYAPCLCDLYNENNESRCNVVSLLLFKFVYKILKCFNYNKFGKYGRIICFFLFHRFKYVNRDFFFTNTVLHSQFLYFM